MLAAACLAQPRPNPALMNPQDPFWKQQAPAQFRVKVTTTVGSFTIEAHREWAPRGVDRFYNLVRAGFYDNSRFYRVMNKDFAQFGIAGDPKVAAVWRSLAIPDDPVKQSNVRGTIAYAMTGPDTRTTQLYIVMGDRSHQDKDGFAPFGKIVDGMDVVDKIYSGYGENAGGGMRAGRQGKMFEGGNAHLDSEYPKLDKLLSARIEQ
jgi:cyclophilin family peptidyl-prolyl cis-trans isomerase